jgi:hypothetical protein
VAQSHWYYNLDFTEEAKIPVKPYRDMAENGYDEIPAGSTWCSPEDSRKRSTPVRRNTRQKTRFFDEDGMMQSAASGKLQKTI